MDGFETVPRHAVHESYLHGRELERERVRTSMIATMGATTGLRDIADEAIIRGYTISKADELMRAAQLEPPRRALGEIGLTKREAQRFSIIRWAEEFVRNGPGGTKDLFEHEASVAVCKAIGRELDHEPGRLHVPLEVLNLQRDLGTNIATAGGFLAHGYKIASFSDVRHAASVIMRLGAETISGLRTDAGIPRVSASATGYWLDSESAAPTESQQTFEDLLFTPKTVGAQCTISRKLLKHASPLVEGVVMRNLGQLLGVAVDAGAIAGDGTLGTPLGILNVPGVGTFTGASLDLAALTNAQVDVSTAGSVNESSLAYVTTPAVAAVLKARQRFTGSSTALWEGKVAAGTVEGCAAISSTSVPTASMIFGDWSAVVIGEWSVLTIDANPFNSNFARGALSLRALWSIDIGVRHVSCFSTASGIT